MKKIGALVIVFSVLFTITIAPIFANEGSVNSVNQTGTFVSTDAGSVSWQIQGTALKPFMYDSSIATAVTGTGNSTYINHYGNYTIAQDFIFLIRFSNTTSDDYACNQGYMSFAFTNTRVDNLGPVTAIGSSVELLQGSLAPNLTTISANGSVQLRWNDEFTYNSGLILPAKSVLYTNIVIRLYYDPTRTDISEVADNYKYQIGQINLLSPGASNWRTITDFTLMNASYNSIEQTALLESIYQQLLSFYSMANNRMTTTNNLLNTFSSTNHSDLVTIHNDLQAILDAYTTNASNVTETQDHIDTVTSNEQQLHTAEQNFYQQNEQALQNVGISNFSFSSDQSSGLGSVITDFTTLWNNIGPLQIIFTFTLSMSLATFLLRHKPVTGAIKKSQQK